MFDHQKLDSYFSGENELAPRKDEVSRHTKFIRLAKLLLPAVAALLIGLLIIYPGLKQTNGEFSIDITLPTKGELEKLHMENAVFYITDKDNKVNNFTAESIDETEPGSKLVKLISPDGIIPSAENQWVNIKAPVGYFNQSTNVLNLLEKVDAYYSDGMTAKTTEATFDFNASKGYGNQPVSAEGTMGTLRSQGFEFYSKRGLLIFTGKTYITIDENSLKGNNSNE